MFVCLFVKGFSTQSRIFHLYGDLCSASMVINQWRFYCDMGHSFIMFISEDAWHIHSLVSVWQWSCHYLFYDLGLSRLGIEHPTFPLRGKRSNRLHHQRGFENMCCKKSVTRGFSDTITRPVFLCLQIKQHVPLSCL